MVELFKINSGPNTRWNIMKSFSASCNWLTQFIMPIAMISFIYPHNPSFKRISCIIISLSLFLSMYSIIEDLPESYEFMVTYIGLQCLLILSRILLLYYLYFMFDFPWNTFVNQIQIEYNTKINLTIKLIKYSNLSYVLIVIVWDCFCLLSELIYLNNYSYVLSLVAICCKHVCLLWPLYISIVIENIICAKYDLYLFQLTQMTQKLDAKHIVLNKYQICLNAFKTDNHWSLKYSILITVIILPLISILLMIDQHKYITVITPFIVLIGWTLGCSDIYYKFKNKLEKNAETLVFVQKNPISSVIHLDYRQLLLFMYVVAVFSIYILVLRQK